jgi:ATP-dependent Clp protease protease subunit
MKTLTITMKSDDVAEVLLYGQIGSSFWEDGIDAKTFREQVKGIKAKTMNLRINSPGGSVTEASAMINALDQWKGRIEVDVDGLAASAASYIAMSGDTVRMATNGLLMIHNPHAMTSGDARELRKLADLLDSVREGMVASYMRKVKATKEELVAWLDAETWFTGTEAVEAGLADSVTEPVRMAALADGAKLFAKLGYKHAPSLEDAHAAALEETRKRREIAASL